MSEKKTTDKMFNPEKYRMNFCHECHVLARTFNKKNSKEFSQIRGPD